MTHLNMIKLGELLRKKRKELGLRMEDLADEQISPSTISNIERGMPNVNDEKVNYFANKLGLCLEKLPELMIEEKEKEEKIKTRLIYIENIIDLMGADKGLEQLKTISIHSSHPLAAVIYFLKGKCYFQKKNWQKAQNYFFESIRLVERTAELKQTNIKAGSLNEIARILYFINDLDQALKYVDEGLEVFVEGGERCYYKHVLLVCKVIYLEKLNRTEEALRWLDAMWSQIHEIENIEVILTMYEMRAIILQKLKLLEESVSYAQKGIELARINKMYERSFELWTTLGSTYIKLGDLDEAENCFLTALNLKEKMRKEYLYISVYTQLGLVYLEQNKWCQAQSVLEEALQIGQRTNNALRFNEALIALGDCFLKQGLINEALVPYSRALEQSQQHGFHNQEHEVLIKLGQCWEKKDPEQFRKCVERLYHVEVLLLKGGEQV
ncbi:helix-turn-helix transcriptional regulator [Hazenella coriacea]|uniref:Helix-turn-helix protein n=1 Tax=Hazenella coriacea TaxID=1179467 RepID=A0A4R3L6Y1_9BACL|nr:helix-turn-helix transcriptional regulator [Hazenella coriacea]TCS94670.1 helix-turn-helix protein [Hazenella coriacea]